MDKNFENERELTKKEVQEILEEGMIINCEDEKLMTTIIEKFLEVGVEAVRVSMDDVGKYVVSVPPIPPIGKEEKNG